MSSSSSVSSPLASPHFRDAAADEEEEVGQLTPSSVTSSSPSSQYLQFTFDSELVFDWLGRISGDVNITAVDMDQDCDDC